MIETKSSNQHEPVVMEKVFKQYWQKCQSQIAGSQGHNVIKLDEIDTALLAFRQAIEDEAVQSTMEVQTWIFLPKDV